MKLLGNLDLGVIAGPKRARALFKIGLPKCLGPAAETSAPARGLEGGVTRWLRISRSISQP